MGKKYKIDEPESETGLSQNSGVKEPAFEYGVQQKGHENIDCPIAQQKNNLIQGILNTNNPDTLREIQEVLNLEGACPNIPAYNEENVKKAIRIALEQEKEGKYKTQEEALKMFGL